VGSARVLPEVAPHRAGLLARRVRGIVVALFRQRVLDREIVDPRLDDDPLVLDIDLQDAVHPGKLDDDAPVRGDGAAREVRTCAPCYVAYAFPVEERDDLSYLIAVLDEGDEARPAFGKPGIVAIDHQ